MPHPLLQWFHDAADGRHPPVDGGVTFLPMLDDGREAVIAFTGHAVIASRLGSDDLVDLRPDGFGGALAPSVLLRLAAGGTIGVNDVTMVARGTGPAGHGGVVLERTRRWDHHPRVEHARLVRRAVAVYGDERGFVTIGGGLGGRLELSIEIVDAHRGTGHGRWLLDQARKLVANGAPLFAAVAPGNARSLRSFLAAGFVPIASEILLSPHESPDVFR
jgi:GNAT superfamily N-acetyltransferase